MIRKSSIHLCSQHSCVSLVFLLLSNNFHCLYHSLLLFESSTLIRNASSAVHMDDFYILLTSLPQMIRKQQLRFFIQPRTDFQRYPKLPKKYLPASKLPLVPLATNPQNNPSFIISLTRIPHLMLDHRKPLPFQHYVLFIIYYVLQTTSVQC